MTVKLQWLIIALIMVEKNLHDSTRHPATDVLPVPAQTTEGHKGAALDRKQQVNANQSNNV